MMFFTTGLEKYRRDNAQAAELHMRGGALLGY